MNPPFMPKDPTKLIECGVCKSLLWCDCNKKPILPNYKHLQTPLNEDIYDTPLYKAGLNRPNLTIDTLIKALQAIEIQRKEARTVSINLSSYISLNLTLCSWSKKPSTKSSYSDVYQSILSQGLGFDPREAGVSKQEPQYQSNFDLGENLFLQIRRSFSIVSSTLTSSQHTTLSYQISLLFNTTSIPTIMCTGHFTLYTSCGHKPHTFHIPNCTFYAPYNNGMSIGFCPVAIWHQWPIHTLPGRCPTCTKFSTNRGGKNDLDTLEASVDNLAKMADGWMGRIDGDIKAIVKEIEDSREDGEGCAGLRRLWERVDLE